MSIRISSLENEGGKLEELTAWDSYHEVAKTARVFTAARSSEQRRRSVTSGNSFPSRRRSVEQTQTSFSAAQDPTSFDSSQREWLEYFAGEGEGKNDAAAAASSADDATRSDGEKNDIVAEQPVASSKPTFQITNQAIRRDIVDIFSIYFEGSHVDTKRRETTRRNPMQQCLYGLWESVNATMPGSQNLIVNLSPGGRESVVTNTLLLVDFALRGIGQVFFQNSPLAGLLILVGLLWQSTRVALHGLLALVAGNWTVYLLGFNMGLARSGLFGYNAVLVGLALATFDSSQTHAGYRVDTLCFSALVGMASSIVFVALGKVLFPYKSPPLTLPFNAATLLFLLATPQMARVQVGVFAPSVPDYSDNDEDLQGITAWQFFQGVLRGLGQVFLADKVLAGVWVLAGLGISSRIAAVAAVLGSALGGGVALATGMVHPSVVAAGLYGYNASLTVTALFTFYAPSWGAAVLALLAGVLTVWTQQAFATLLQPWGLPVMTLPFCAVCLPFIILQGTTSKVIAIPLEQLTVPEDHVQKVKTLRDGIHFLKDAIQGSEAAAGNPQANSPSSSSAAAAYGETMRRSMQQVEWAISDSEAPVRGRGSDNRRLRWAQQAATHIFSAIVTATGKGNHHTAQLPLETFLEALAQSGMTDRSGRQFVSLVFHLMDLDRSNAIDHKEFVALCRVSCAIAAIRRKISKFLDFVDRNANGSIDFDEIDAALEYLGQPALFTEERQALAKRMGVSATQGEMEVVHLINFITVQKLKAMVTAYHNSTTTDTSSSAMEKEEKSGESPAAAAAAAHLQVDAQERV